jgi:aerotolerance regulator-like protein
MTFVYPLLLGGLVLAGIPVLLHFLVRQKPKTLVFPAYRFLMQKKKTNTRKLRLRNLLLLLMRIALIVLICLALARPRVQHEALGALSREKPVALVLVFDTTPSMAYPVGQQTRLELAKARAQELLDQLPDDCRVLVLDAADPANFGREEWQRSIEKARTRIQGLAIRPESVPVNDALREAYRRFDTWDDADGMQLPRFVCVFSDRTKPSWDNSASAKRPDNVQALYFDVGIDEPTDFAVVSAEIASGKQSFLAGDNVPLRVLVKATGAKLENTLVVKIVDAPEKYDLRQNIPLLDAGKEQIFALDIDTAGLKPGLHQAVVQFANEPDGWVGNNQRFVTFRILEKPRVLVVTDDRKRTERFRFALQCLNYKAEQATVAESPDLRKYDAVFVVSVAAPPEKLWRELATTVKDGRGVCIVPPGEELERTAYNNEIAQKVMPAEITKAETANNGTTWDLSDLDQLQHPFLSSYRNWLAQADFNVVVKPGVVDRYWKVKGGKEIVHYEGGDAAVVERPADKKSGKVILLTTPMDDVQRDRAWNNYHERLQDSYYLALTMFCAQYLCAPPENTPLNFEFGQAAPTFALGSQLFPKYELVSDDAAEEIRFDERGRWTAERLARAGNYTIRGINPETSEKTVLHQFSINIASAESDLTRVSVDDIESALGKNAVTPQDRRRSIADTLDWEEPVELFPWLMIALLFFLAIENLLANRFYRKEPLTA